MHQFIRVGKNIKFEYIAWRWLGTIDSTHNIWPVLFCYAVFFRMLSHIGLKVTVPTSWLIEGRSCRISIASLIFLLFQWPSRARVLAAKGSISSPQVSKCLLPHYAIFLVKSYRRNQWNLPNILAYISGIFNDFFRDEIVPLTRS